MLRTRWSTNAWSVVRVEFRRANWVDSPTSATGAMGAPPWRATQRGVWEALGRED